MTAGEATTTDGTNSADSARRQGAARASALGNELIEIHEWLRQSLDRLRDDLNSPAGRLHRPPFRACGGSPWPASAWASSRGWSDVVMWLDAGPDVVPRQARAPRLQYGPVFP
jgi:hypothetical protein